MLIFKNVLIIFLLFIFSACSKSSTESFQGYVEGEFVNIGSSEGGRLEKVFVQKGQQITINTPLFALEAVSENSQISKTKAALAQSIANVQKSTLEFEKDKKLYAQNAISSIEYEQVLAKAKVDQSQVLSDKAMLRQAEWSLSQKALKSNTDGQIFDILYREGEFVPAASPIIRLLPPQNIKIRFFVTQDMIHKLPINSTVGVEVDSKESKINAHINYISPNAEYTSPLIYSNENAHKLVFMIEAKPDPLLGNNLHPGQPVRIFLK